MNGRIDHILGDIALFVEVAKAKSIKRAAEALGIPDSTLSRRITGLEKSLGLQLLHRSTRRIELTEAGQIYYAQCKPIVEAAELAQARLKALAETPQGKLRLSLPIDFSALFMAPLIAEFARVFPQITFDLRLTEHWVDLLEEGIDVAIRLGLQSESALTIRHLGDVHHELYAAPEYLQLRGIPNHPRELVQHSCIRMVCPHWSETWTLFKSSQVEQVSIGERIAVNNVGLVKRFAMLGLGIAPLDRLLAQEDVAAGSLCRVLPLWHFSPVPVFALTPTKHLPEKTRAFLQFLTNRMRDSMKAGEDFRHKEGAKERKQIDGVKVWNVKNGILNSVNLPLSSVKIRSSHD
jgi:DNA-binding transcriptional LysR family regulator